MVICTMSTCQTSAGCVCDRANAEALRRYESGLHYRRRAVEMARDALQRAEKDLSDYERNRDGHMAFSRAIASRETFSEGNGLW